jgi:uncharacterized membrane protein (TIGR02234 family)
MTNGGVRSRALAFGCLLVGGALAVLASAQPWWRGSGEGAAVRFTGSQVTGGLSQALAIAALVGTLLMLGLRSRGRRVVGGVLLLVGVGVAVAAGSWMQPRTDATRSHASTLDTFGLAATVWPWICVLAGALIAAGATLTMITASSWSSAAERFQAGSNQAQLDTIDAPAKLWKAMDAGVDPTADDRDTLTVADPEMRDRRSGDTMDGTGQARQVPWAPTSPNIGNRAGQAQQQGRGEREVWRSLDGTCSECRSR